MILPVENGEVSVKQVPLDALKEIARFKLGAAGDPLNVRFDAEKTTSPASPIATSPLKVVSPISIASLESRLANSLLMAALSSE